MRVMRLLTWNINGVRTLPQYHPWNDLKSFDEILQNLEADVICFQEMKSGRKLLSKDIAVPPSFDAFFSFPINKTGYSGVGIYTRKDTVVPSKAEEGLSGVLQLKPPLSASERISDSDDDYLSASNDDEGPLDLKDLDSEGRALILDFGLFVLINTYCPNGAGGTRTTFKADYHRLLEARVHHLITHDHRQVIVVGDLNACAAVIDHCEGGIMVAKGLAEGLEGEEGFWGMGCRTGLRDWLQDGEGKGGPMVDVVRRFWPDRKGMYTCWNTKISARETNYGTRIDFILTTPGLLPWVKAGDIQPHIRGSDHCPVYIDFHDHITTPSGDVVYLRDVLGAREEAGKPKDPPRLSARFWEEFSGRQTSLQQFFGGAGTKKASSASQTPSTSISTSTTPTPTVIPPSPPEVTPTPSPAEPTPSDSVPASTSVPTSTSTKRKLVPQSPSSSKKPKTDPAEKKKQRPKKGQQSISSFFGKPPTAKSQDPTISKIPTTSSTSTMIESVIDTEDEDYKFALQLSQEPSSPLTSPPSSQSTSKNDEGKQAWSSLFAPLQPPKCRAHGEVAKEYTVNKPGLNKGKKFFICSRPVGPGYDKGKTERLREHVDPQYKCDFFKWASDVKRDMMMGNGSQEGGS